MGPPLGDGSPLGCSTTRRLPVERGENTRERQQHGHGVVRSHQTLRHRSTELVVSETPGMDWDRDLTCGVWDADSGSPRRRVPPGPPTGQALSGGRSGAAEIPRAFARNY